MLDFNTQIVMLIFSFQLKHFLADFAFQTGNMAMGKCREDWSYIKPLAQHCLVHAIFTGIVIISFFGLSYWPLIILDFIIHFIIDRLKASPKLGGSVKESAHPQLYWILFGLDQLLHQSTYLFFIYLIYKTSLFN